MNAIDAAAAAPQTLGFGHFLAQSDAVGRALLVLLLAMSALSWLLIGAKSLARLVQRRRSRRFLDRFWNAATLDEVSAGLREHGAAEPFAHLASQALHAQAHHAQHGAARLAEAGSAAEFLTRTIKKVLDQESSRLDNGLTLLATVGATAPFVGLFGTVWGVYHALLAIGSGGAGSLDKVAGPVGEALIMTALGLAVAIPAVVAYNALARSNRVLAARLDAFAFELHTFLSTGRAIGAAPSPAQATARAEPAAAGGSLPAPARGGSDCTAAAAAA